MGQRPWEPKDFVADLLRNERIHFQGSPSTRSRQEQRKQELSHRLNRGADRLESGQPQQFIATVRGSSVPWSGVTREEQPRLSRG